MLASGVSKRCLEAGQRLRVQVTDPSLTATLRSELNPKTKENHWSLAMAMAEIVDADWLGITLTHRRTGFFSTCGVWNLTHRQLRTHVRTGSRRKRTAPSFVW